MPAATLSALPPELLAQILTSISTDGDLANLAQTCTSLRAWLLPALSARHTHLCIGTVGVTEDDSHRSAALRIHARLLVYLRDILTCPALRYLPRSALVGFVAYPATFSSKADHRGDGGGDGGSAAASGSGNGSNGMQQRQQQPWTLLLCRDEARRTVFEASRRAGFKSRGAADVDNLDFLTGLVLCLSPGLEEVKVDYSNLTLCHFMATVGGFRLVQDALPGDVSTWVRRKGCG